MRLISLFCSVEDTLKSDMTVQEFKWAMQYREQNREEQAEEKKIIPIWHSGFDYHT